MLEVPKPLFPVNQPAISNQNPPVEDNSLSTPKTLKKTPEKLISEISPRTPEKFLLASPSKKSDQLKTNQSLALIANQEQNTTKTEQILLQKIKLLERENKNLKAENQCLKELVQQERTRADNYHQQLKIIVNTLKQ